MRPSSEGRIRRTLLAETENELGVVGHPAPVGPMPTSNDE
jgi:hypothetical protein